MPNTHTIQVLIKYDERLIENYATVEVVSADGDHELEVICAALQRAAAEYESLLTLPREATS